MYNYCQGHDLGYVSQAQREIRYNHTAPTGGYVALFSPSCDRYENGTFVCTGGRVPSGAGRVYGQEYNGYVDPVWMFIQPDDRVDFSCAFPVQIGGTYTTANCEGATFRGESRQVSAAIAVELRRVRELSRRQYFDLGDWANLER